MQDTLFLLCMLIPPLAQIGCFYCKKRWLRLLPTLIHGAIMLLCIVVYCLSGFTNWAWLVLFFLLAAILVVLGIAWFIYGIIRAIKQSK